MSCKFFCNYDNYINMFKVDVPVLLIGFNRPDLIEQNLENLRQQHVQNLYITIDGPRTGRDDDFQKVEEVRSLVKAIDFCPNVHLKIREQNVGCEVNVSEGIAWVLEEEEYVIVLEDDVMAHESFFRFMQEMLIRYKDDDCIAMVSGCNFTPMPFPNDEDYCFCQSGHTNGWGTWKRVWKMFNLYEEIKPEHLKLNYLKVHSANNEIAWRRKFVYSRMRKHGVGNSTWDMMFAYLRVVKNMLSIVPAKHLTSNVGLYGLHCAGEDKGLLMEIDDEFKVVSHPTKVVWNKEYDSFHYFNYVKESIFKKIIRRIKKYMK